MGDVTTEQITDENNFLVSENDSEYDVNNNTEIKTNNNESTNRAQNVKFYGKDLKITQSQLYILCLLCPYFFLTSSYYSLFAPFFPVEALKKNITQTQIGLIFGCFQLAFLVLAPMFGKYIDHFGVKFLFVSGLFLSSTSEILFGFLDMCPDGFIYFAMCIICRCVTALGSAMGQSFAICSCYFPNKISSIVGLMQLFNGLGIMIGPPLGGFLYQMGGFELPFFFMGGLLFLIFMIALIIFPKPPVIPSRLDRDYAASLPMLPLLKIPKFLMTLQMLFVGSLSIGFIEPSIQPHLSPLKLKPIELGLILFIPGLLYALTTPFVGHCCDKYPKSMPWFMFMSAFSSAISFSFLGPLPWFKLPLKLSIVLSGFVAFGFSLGGLVIPVYSQLNKIALENGYSNDLRTQGLISGIFSSVWSLGSLIGPVAGGIVVDILGFSLASFIIVFAFLLTALLFAIFYMIASDQVQPIALDERFAGADEDCPLMDDYTDNDN